MSTIAARLEGAATLHRRGLLLFFSQGLIVRAENHYDPNEALQAIRET
jgi:hypothetical protein